jgi:hypothetical protein
MPQAVSASFSSANMRRLLDHAARIAAVSLAHGTQPFGLDKQAREKGEGAVARDVKKSVLRVGDAYASIKRVNVPASAAFWKAVKAKKWPDAQRILDQSGAALAGIPILAQPDEARRKAARTDRGRPRGKASQILQSTRLQSRYIKEAQKRVGTGKGGWAACAYLLKSTRGIPAWVTRHGHGTGTVIRLNSRGRPRITLINRVRYSSEILPANEKARAHRLANERMSKFLASSIRAIKARRKR